MARERVSVVAAGFGFTRAELAQLVGVNLSTVYRWEKAAERVDPMARRWLALLSTYPAAARPRIGARVRELLALEGSLAAARFLLNDYPGANWP